MLITEPQQKLRVAFPRHPVGMGTVASIGHGSASCQAAAEAQSDSNEHGIPSRVKILVADDEQTIANTLARILDYSGFEARPVYSGEAAIEACRSFHPDVLISDVFMPGMTGIEAALVIRSSHPSCKILLFSGQASRADLLQSSGGNAQSFEIMEKPVHPLDILAKLRRA